MNRKEEITLSFRKKFHKDLFTQFAKALNTYELVVPGDEILIELTGTRESFLAALLFQEIKRHNKFEFTLHYYASAAGKDETVLRGIQALSEELELPLVCGEETKEGYALRHGAGKITGTYCYDDAVVRILSDLLYRGEIHTCMPKQKLASGLTEIHPMYLVRRETIRHFETYHTLSFPVKTEEPSFEDRETEALIGELMKRNPYIENNIFRSVENCNLSTLIGYTKNGDHHNFTEWYEKEGET